jgi:hypothetical protein
MNKANNKITDPLLLLASGDPDNGASMDEYGPLDEALLRLLLAVEIATQDKVTQRFGCFLERAISQAFAYSEHGQVERELYILIAK